MSWLLIAFITLLVTFYSYRKLRHRYLKKLGIPGPEPHFLFGNMWDLWREDSHLVMNEWAKKYGDVFGYYEGSRPVLVFSSIAGAESVCVRQCGAFQGRMASPIQPDSEKEPGHPLINLLLAKGDRWRKPRMTANRFFSIPKMRTVLPVFEKRLPLLLAIIEKSQGQPLSVGEYFERFAMDSLAEAGFGLSLKLLEPDDKRSGKLSENPVFRQSRQMMSTFLHFTPFPFKVVSALPEIIPPMKFIIHLVMKYSAGPLSPFLCLFTMMAKTIEHRRATEESHQPNSIPDLVRLFMNVTKFRDEKDNGSTAKKDGPDEKFMCEQELKAQLVTLFLSGYETTSVSLTFISAVLATNQDVQAKLVTEIAKVFPDPNEPLDYDRLVSMEYLECVCCELLRVYPVAINAVNRLVAADDVTVCGCPVTRDISKVLVNVWTIHRDPEQWGADPDKFWPERFLPDNLPSGQSRSAFLGFGLGPHQCVGKMFSQIEIKYVIVQILRRYKLASPSSNATDESGNIPVRVAIVMTPRDPVKVIFTPREN